MRCNRAAAGIPEPASRFSRLFDALERAADAADRLGIGRLQAEEPVKSRADSPCSSDDRADGSDKADAVGKSIGGGQSGR